MSTKRFGTFDGVFTPTFLSILGVIMFLRLGWVVGQVGLMGALVIIIISNLITLFTGLSASSITTNIKIGAGGAYSIISKSLGYEVGGAIGIPLYISQAISVAFYVTGFAECWVSVFPQHGFIFVSLAVWLVLLIISYASAKFAFRLQYGIMAVIGLALLSVFLARNGSSQDIVFSQGVMQVPFWAVFAIFFPAVTGILAGISMSGELKDPERNIPVGTISAIVVSFVIYLSLAFWFAKMAGPQDLVHKTSIVIDLARWRFWVIAGIMGATLSSALSMFIAAPRVLLALSKHKIVPFWNSLSRVNKRDEPVAAILFTALIALITISLGNLNNIASLLTMFFLITYGMLNIAVFIEKSIGIISFRPAFEIPLIVPLLGGAGCVYAMFLINPFFSIIALVVTASIYLFLLHNGFRKDWPDVRKGLFLFIAEQSLKIAESLPYHPKIWKPDLLIPVEDPENWRGVMDIVKAIAYPRGRVEFLTILEGSDSKNMAISKADDPAKARDKYLKDLSMLGKPVHEEGMIVSSLVINAGEFIEGIDVVLQARRNSFLPPNVVFVKLGSTASKDPIVGALIEKITPQDLGLMIYKHHPGLGLGRKNSINVWIRQGSPNMDLAVLVALQLERNWEADLRLLQSVPDAEKQKEAKEYLLKLKNLMRLPKEAQTQVIIGNFGDIISTAPSADLNIFGMPKPCEVSWLRKISGQVKSSALFLKDSTQESALV